MSEHIPLTLTPPLLLLCQEGTPRDAYGGKHEFMIKGAMKLPIPNPHGRSEISVGKLREILNEIGVSRDEWHRAA